MHLKQWCSTFWSYGQGEWYRAGLQLRSHMKLSLTCLDLALRRLNWVLHAWSHPDASFYHWIRPCAFGSFLALPRSGTMQPDPALCCLDRDLHTQFPPHITQLPPHAVIRSCTSGSSLDPSWHCKPNQAHAAILSAQCPQVSSWFQKCGGRGAAIHAVAAPPLPNFWTCD